MTTETRTRHLYYFYGRMLSGYGPSMDPHRCGARDEPCVTITEEREVGPWKIVNKTIKGDFINE